MMRPSVPWPTGTWIGAPVELTAHRDGAHHTVAQLLLHFERQFDIGEPQGLVDLRHRFTWKLHVDDRADDLCNLASCHVGFL
jgi:hypothetical protein